MWVCVGMQAYRLTVLMVVFKNIKYFYYIARCLVNARFFSLPLEGKGDRLRWMRCDEKGIQHLLSHLTVTAFSSSDSVKSQSDCHRQSATLKGKA